MDALDVSGKEHEAPRVAQPPQQQIVETESASPSSESPPRKSQKPTTFDESFVTIREVGLLKTEIHSALSDITQSALTAAFAAHEKSSLVSFRSIFDKFEQSVESRLSTHLRESNDRAAMTDEQLHDHSTKLDLHDEHIKGL